MMGFNAHAREIQPEGVFSIQEFRAEAQAENAVKSGKKPSGRGMTSEQGIYTPPQEPFFKLVKFLKQDPPANMQQRVERLLHGVYTYMPPEFDYYGYEIRRYMAGIAGPLVLGDSARIDTELGNIRKAKIVLQYWQKALVQEVQDVSKEIEADEAISQDVRTAFKYNQGVINNFIVDTDQWLTSNEIFLNFMRSKIPEQDYQYQDPYMEFLKEEDREQFIKLFKARETARVKINSYTPFMMMVY